MKHPALYLTFMVALSFLSCHEKKILPIDTPPSPCDREFILALENWPDSLDTTPDLAASHLEKILRDGGECHDSVSDLTVAEAWHWLGNRFLDIEEYSKALNCFQNGLKLRFPILKPDHKDVLRSYTMIGSALSGLKDYHAALTYYDSAGVWTQEASTVPFIYNMLMRGISNMELKELSRAKMYLQMASDSIPIKGGIAYRWLSEVLIQYSSCCRMMGLYKEAIDKGNESLEWISAAPAPVLTKANAYLAIGNAYQDSALYCLEPDRRRQLIQQAILYTNNAIALYQTLPNARASVILTAGNFGEIYRRAGQYDEAIKLLSAVLDTQPDRKAPNLAQLYINRGETWMDKGNFEQAMRDYNAALTCFSPAYQSGGPLPSPNAPVEDRPTLLLLLGDMASAYLDKASDNQAYLDTAATTFDTLLALLNVIRGDFLSDEAKIALAGDSRNILDKAFGGYLQLSKRTKNTKRQKYLERAFSISEQRKSFALLEAARLNNADAILPDSLRQQKRALAKEQADIDQKMLANWNNPESMKPLTAERLRIMERSRRLERKIAKLFPNYDNLKQKGADLSIPVIQNEMLGDDQAMIEYFCRDSTLEIFLISKTDFKHFSVPIDRDDFRNEVNTFIQLLARPDVGGMNNEAREKQLCSKAHELYQILLGPLKKENLPSRLIIIPDAPFLTLPFEALAMRASSGNIRRHITDNNFVLFQYCISYCFSANLLREMQMSESTATLTNELAAFAPSFPEHLAAGANLPPSFVQTVKDLKPLGNDRELEEIARVDVVPIQPYLNQNASKEHFWEACRKYAFVHVATHGILNQDPNLNFVAFSQNTDTLDQTQLLFLRDLYTQHLHQDLIVFSACETTLGQYREGEGNISMARGLAYSGVRSFITTLWKVPTDANRVIMPMFYEYFLGKKLPKDVALAEARRMYVKGSSDNITLDNWAGLVLIGCTDYPRPCPWWKWGIAAIAIASVLGFWVRNRRRSAE